MVYLHKTSLVADYILVKILKRAKELVKGNEDLISSEPLKYFLTYNSNNNFNDVTLDKFAEIDDYDIIMAVKQWMNHSDYVLSALSKSFINRNLPKIIIQDAEFSTNEIEKIKLLVSKKLNLNDDLIEYFVGSGIIENQAYNLENSSINILYKSGEIKDITVASDHLNLLALAKPVLKHFIYHPK
jgi:HD superfamily phosphohydrolase